MPDPGTRPAPTGSARAEEWTRKSFLMPKGSFELTGDPARPAMAEVNASRNSFGKPVKLAPHFYWAVTDDLSLGISHRDGLCLNGCDKCELCIGKTELPPECNPSGTGGAGGGSGGGGGIGGAGGGGTGQCPPGNQACGLPGQAPCDSGYYCITGCCQLNDVPK